MHEHTTSAPVPAAGAADSSEVQAEGAEAEDTRAEDTQAGVPAPAGRTRPAGPRGSRTSKALLAAAASASLIIAAAGTVVVAGSLLPQPDSTRSLPVSAAAVPAGSSLGICPGPARLLDGAGAGSDPQFSAESETASTSVTAAVLSAAGVLPPSRLARVDGAGAVEIVAGQSQQAAAGAPQELKAGVLSGRSVDQAMILSADAVENQQASAAGAVKFTATDGDLQGAAAVNCQPPSNDQWLAGASTTIGRTSLLVLSNASSTPATVNLELFGAEGRIQAPGSRGLLVAPGTTRSVVLAGLAPGEPQLGVHVRSAGGPVSAVIQQSALRGLTPGGVDFIAPGAAPGVRQVMTGVDIQDPGQVAALTGQDGYEDAGPALQLTVPGPSDAVVEVKLFGRDGQKALPSGGVITAKAGAVTEIPLAGVPAGQYTVAASSDVSFVAAARMTRGLRAGQPSDVAWAASAVRLGSQHVVPVPAGGQRTLVLGALDNRATISYSPITADGKVGTASTADIAGGTTAAISIPEQAGSSGIVGYLVSASGDAAYGALLVQQDGRNDISSLAFLPAAAGSETVPVTLSH